MAGILEKLDAAMSRLMAWLRYPATYLLSFLRNKFVLEKGKIVFYRDGLFSHEEIAISDIAYWEADAVMGRDIVRIAMNDGKTIVWFDECDDLILLLRECIPNGRFVDDAS
jgi:hypothetical protein